MIDVSRQRRSLLADAAVLDHLPAELLDIIKDSGSTQFLDAVSEAALIPSLTDEIFAHFEDIIPDICARWILNTADHSRRSLVASALARVLPFAPYLSNFLLTSSKSTDGTLRPPPLQLALPTFEKTTTTTPAETLLPNLITIWRLLNFDSRTFRSCLSPSLTQDLFSHENRAVRYVAIRIFCILLNASDYKLDALVAQHVGKERAVMGDLDGGQIDYWFLSLHEHARVKKVLANCKRFGLQKNEAALEPFLQELTPYVIAYGGTLLPRPYGPLGDPSTLVMTSTTTSNFERLASLLHQDEPTLLHGLPGVGKTSLIHEIAKQLGMYSSMVTLHLNEQTDAKMLIGLYTTGSKPGSFLWRPGVLTTAVKEGRWVLVEDLDRAPTEVLSTLLPLIERRELLIPSRGEHIRAARSFRLFATVRSSHGMHGRENLPSLVGMRFWQMMPIQQMAEAEIQEVISKTHPILSKFVPGILAVYGRLLRLSTESSRRFRSSGSIARPVNLRDLLKWCRRIRECLLATGSTTGDEPISEATRDWMFMEALDCFVGSCPDSELSAHLMHAIAEEMHLSKDRADHYVAANIPPLVEHEHQLTIGRARLRKRKSASKTQKSTRPFASTTHAKKLLEQIAVAVKLNEPVLLVGETGIGKTTVVQQLAESLGHKLIAVNLSQQSEVGDLLGGFKPVNVRSLAVPLKEEFEDLFAATGISASKNQKYLEQVGRCFAKGQWSRVSKLWKEAPKMFLKIVKDLEQLHSESPETRNGDAQPSKRRKTTSKLQGLLELRPRWDLFSRNLDQFNIQISGGSESFAFSFVEGNLIKAVRNGDWVLLDEINLATPDTLESIADLLTGPGERPSILLSETGEIEKIVAHPNFRIFGAMNPATDVGKRDLPIGIRSRFTELYVRSPDSDLKDLLHIIKTYLGSSSTKNDQASDDIARLYLNTKRMAEEKRLVDGANEVPHFSLRTLTRVLSYVNTIAPFYGLRRALYEGFSMGFLTLLDRESEGLLVPLVYHHLLDKGGNPQSILSQPPKHPEDGRQYVKFVNQNRDRHYWLFQGNEQPIEREDYIITPFVERNLLNLVRATSTRRFPILIQGPTSAGKTSMIEYLANFTGNRFVRINNHEHTDLQEYLGTYVSGPDGTLRFQEGLLVQAMRQGHWIVLDELNLAPTDVLEALNRLLDDNRELLIPETQEVVRPHENFILFATQNPAGLYGGRKALSRAFRNRFLELHFDDIPEDELEFILQRRSRNTSPPDCRRIVSVYKELSRLRQTNRLFEQKDSFATLRDLFRWALREADTRDDIAAHGFMLLAERVRNDDEREVVKTVIEKVFKIKIDTEKLYAPDLAPELKQVTRETNSQGVVWTHAMRRLYVLVARALKNNEPVLLVGETGCGKTTVCQVLAEALGQKLHIVNAHQNTETGDLIGSQRPIRNRGAILEALDADLNAVLGELNLDTSGTVEDRLQRYCRLDDSLKKSVPTALQDRIKSNQVRSKALFEWSDGALVEAMKDGQFFLLDEISLADDSVLERLNSVLEAQRTLLLAEKGIDDSFVVASPGFQFFATMNPGGDFGKKELSPALRNRFTEIWVSPLSEDEDIRSIAHQKLRPDLQSFAEVIVKFATWFGETFRSTATSRFSVREVLAWVQFIDTFQADDPVVALVHGASTVFIDSLGANPSAIFATDTQSILQLRQNCLTTLSHLLGRDISAIYQSQPELVMTDGALTIGDFSIARAESTSTEPGFSFQAPTTRLNAMRVIRALQMNKPILLEGSPGVGKTTLVAALAKTCGRPLTRINLSDQTDLMDLFGTDVPVEGAEAGNFAWRDAPFLQAMQRGEWVLLDEMNLASQSVLEGLNACLDHRGEVYISELDQVFKRHPEFRLFAAQNPHHQGGGRKGLPSSFVNRFIVVYADVFTAADLRLISRHNFPSVSAEEIDHLIQFISQLEHHIVVEKSLGSQGGPWEFNLRDILRWLNLYASSDLLLSKSDLDSFLDIIVRQRFRTPKDRAEVTKLFTSTFGSEPQEHSLYHDVNSRFGQVGLAILPRSLKSQPQDFPPIDVVSRLPELESLMICAKQNIPCILSSPSGNGKSALLKHVAALAGKELVVFPMNADVDAMDLVGGFEQADPLREANAALRNLLSELQDSILSLTPAAAPIEALHLLELLDKYNGDTDEIEDILSLSEAVLKMSDNGSQLGKSLSHAIGVMRSPLILANPRFEWLDGVIIKALQAGQWLVLDNANLCSASVLDRLNSLLEPNGFLSVNEHCDPSGEPRIVKPHPDFRIFLTVDPRYGELSRAMRNRAVEIHIQSPPPVVEPSFGRVAGVESGLLRYLDIQNNLEQSISALWLQNLSFQDMPFLCRYIDDFLQPVQDSDARHHPEGNLLQFLESQQGSNSMAQIAGLYDTLSDGKSLALQSVQPIYPLNNFTVVQLLPRTDQARWVAECFELYRCLNDFHQLIEASRRQAQITKIASLSRLERSLISNRVAAVSKDSTVQLVPFLSSTMESLQRYLAGGFSPECWRDRVTLLKRLALWLKRTFVISSDMSFDEAKFQAHLGQGRKLLSARLLAAKDEEHQLLIFLLDLVSNAFSSGFHLSSGLSMEQLWNMFRPVPIANKSAFDHSCELDRLGVRFDALRWKANSSIADVSKVLMTLGQAFKIVREDANPTAELVLGLKTEIEALESRIGSEDGPHMKPFLSEEFETLRQLLLMRSIASTEPLEEPSQELVALSKLPTKAEMMRAVSKNGAALLQSVDYLICQGQYPWDGKFSVGIWSKLRSMGSVALRDLALLELELPAMAKHVAKMTPDIGSDPLCGLNDILWHLLLATFGAHASPLKDLATIAFEKALDKSVSELELPSSTSLFDDLLAAISLDHLRDAVRSYFIPSMLSLASARRDTHKKAYHSAMAWIHFSIGALQLYVPDKAFDPQLQPMMEREFLEELRTGLTDKKSALHAFERSFTGQYTSERTRIVEQELTNLGPIPQEVQPVYRPENSELNRLQAEFTNVLHAINSPALASTVELLGNDPVKAVEGLPLVKENIHRLLDRLSSRFEAYQDITQPAANLLQCLLIGLSLCETASTATLSAPTKQLVRIAPFFENSTFDLKNFDLSSNKFEFLDVISAIVAVEGRGHLQASERELVFQCFHQFNEEWSERLKEDRETEEARSSLYKFKGTFEDEEELDEAEFEELFPTYDNEDSAPKPIKRNDQARNASLKVASAHRLIFLDQVDPLVALREACLAVSSCIASEMQQKANIDMNLNHQMLPGVVTLLDTELARLTSASAEKSYNFYTDGHLQEARQLVNLAYKIKTRFRDLQEVDEIGHMQPLADVLQSCDKLLDTVHTEPLAKILPLVEHLHAYVYEWQFGGWASKAHAVLSLHSALTETIIRWRRLELSTWAKLLDTELNKCQDDAYSWWFIAYQAVVAAPLSMLDDPSALQSYATSLLHELELYFSTSIIGQYKTRLALLRQLCNHVALLAEDYSSLDVIRRAVGNFISFYERFEKSVLEAIQKGRAPIEKKMKDVLLVASWKDTNIAALRESARKSHQKLFRLVRKFRRVLGQEMKSLVQQGLPDEDIHTPDYQRQQVATVEVPATTFARLNAVLPGWIEKTRRLANISTTVSVMKQVTGNIEMGLDFSHFLDEYVDDFDSAVTALRKETPAFLTDENKDQVKHLKNRKRKLFADTLKELRKMGLSYNLAQDKLSQQDSLSAILSTTESLAAFPFKSLTQTDYYFHKAIDLMPSARAAAWEHSDELTGAEVNRSIGFAEGIIHFLLAQRQNLGVALRSFTSLKEMSSLFLTLAKCEELGSISNISESNNLPRLAPWLVQIVNFGIRLVQCHGRLRGAPYDSTVEHLQSHSMRIARAFDELANLGELPQGLTSEVRVRLETNLKQEFEALRLSIDRITSDAPELGFILQQIRAWTQLKESPIQVPSRNLGFRELADAVSTTCDTILVAIESAKRASEKSSTGEADAGSLMKQNECVSSVIGQLHMKAIASSLEKCVHAADRLDLDQEARAMAVMSAFGVATPILNQFLILCESILSRSLDAHSAVNKMAYKLIKTFTQLASRGFCTPQEKSNESSEDTGQVESGTGLGEGEGAEDISKDIQPDEDLSELAQEANKEERGEVEDEKDAVDMADEELEGELGSMDGSDKDDTNSKDGDEDEDEDGPDEEAGDVDDLDPTAVDEKMWDGAGEDEAEKDQEGDKAKGEKSKDEKVAADDGSKQEAADEDQDADQNDEDDKDDAESPDEEREDAQAQDELNRQDQTAQENDTLALPDDMELDLDDHESASSDGEMDQMSDIEEKQEPENGSMEDEKENMQPEDTAHDKEDEMGNPDADAPEDDGVPEEMEIMDEDEPEPEPKEETDKAEEQNDPSLTQKDKATADTENAAPSDVKSAGQDDENGDSMELDEQFQAQAAQQDDGDMGEGATDRDKSTGNKGATSRSNETIQQAEEEQNASDTARSDPFKKLGDTLERWHRQRADIKQADAGDDADQRQAQDKSEAEMGQQELQHLQNDETAADTQALGTADKEEAQPIDESMAMEEEDKEAPPGRVMEDDEDQEEAQQPEDMDVHDEAPEQTSAKDEREEGRSGVTTRQGNFDKEPSPAELDAVAKGMEDDEEAIQETSTQLSTTHIADDERPLRDFAEASEQWTQFQNKTHSLALSLTSQLRLILTPSQSTKLSGSFRTGKRLNIKRIIPYIASSYKRDKIWMRRSIPTKRTYQILLCVDDSQSMGESSSGSLALESLVMMTRSLTMLEAGQIGVLGFGGDVFTAHQLTDPFASDAGAKVLQNFTFSQDRTDIALLVRQTIDTFRAARHQSGGNADLWQLSLILSDGLTPSAAHESIRRLLREALEEQIMIVFIIMDDKGKKEGDSVLELKEAKFVKDGAESKVVIERYLDTFPFQYYLIVHNLEELPGALAGLLRTWFAEVNH